MIAETAVDLFRGHRREVGLDDVDVDGEGVDDVTAGSQPPDASLVQVGYLPQPLTPHPFGLHHEPSSRWRLHLDTGVDVDAGQSSPGAVAHGVRLPVGRGLRQVADHTLHQRYEQTAQRHVAPGQVEGGRPQQHVPRGAPALHQGGLAIVEAGQHGQLLLRRKFEGGVEGGAVVVVTQQALKEVGRGSRRVQVDEGGAAGAP